MATEQQARRARDLHQNNLIAAGAHSLSVEPVPGSTKGKRKSFGVVAWVRPEAKEKQAPLPPVLQVSEKGRTVKVPLVVRQSEPFQLE